MSTYNVVYRPKNEFDLQDTSIDSLIMTAEGVLEDFKKMKELGVVINDNQSGNISMDCETTDPKTIIELKSLGFEKLS
ncbi:hypothetical protein Eyrgjafa_gp_10 [Pelagibacter phage Eyrgjafa EXVC018P]|uniref:Uncharacterized protein n=1 Tax=Pelagibacter phage Eyrgjafa EXVC018P TaxID=2736227 RepID=A0A7S5Y930_9CAUD|nr:hypothetical protein Eyrgjafa_gp_10 [Pelagibacter phage Eyrgjafa EXVC018P]QLF88215.1 hypothetical protein Gjalp_gp23 [Pelagibacter phage Gjalp EXVC020P]